ncbi:hypothetical protein MF271_09565 [Deinococcus sp. KNUC1210]|uniref:hypothetical protein n=1 Tax=Deinococcus sp. KNUC1210 TaxID=2917691 RepID=UPI001EF0D25C|nr:hypothetical protein [Deinococcus sp. KNUC1210]ULH16789.1 hypothetical protein MF271_09565 [Deinococcus sp. KNUC1210]
MKNTGMVKVLAMLTLSVAGLGMASASPVTLDQLSGAQELSVVYSDNTTPYVSFDASTIGVTGAGDISQLAVSTPQDSGVTASISHARNEAGTLFVYLNIDSAATDAGQSLRSTLPLTITNTVTGASTTVDVQVSATADLE